MRKRRDLTGERFGRLVVSEYDHTDRRGQSYWRCLCDCGNTTVVRGSQLTAGSTVSCGCKKHEPKRKDLTGMRFGQLRVIDYSHTDHNNNAYWRCLCDCGNETTVQAGSLVGGRTSSCGCKKRGSIPEDLTGRRFGRLVVLGYDHTNSRGNSYWHCLCDCGNERVVDRTALKNGSTTSCGCYNREIITTHGMSYTPLYRAWDGIKRRCNNQTDARYKYYGARGISYCDDWESFENFRDWALDNGYEEGLSIDRIDNDNGYYPENCRWVDSITQANNRRTNRCVTWGDDTHTIAEWARIFKVDYNALHHRIQRGDMRDFEEYFKEDPK